MSVCAREQGFSHAACVDKQIDDRSRLSIRGPMTWRFEGQDGDRRARERQVQLLRLMKKEYELHQATAKELGVATFPSKHPMDESFSKFGFYFRASLEFDLFVKLLIHVIKGL